MRLGGTARLFLAGGLTVVLCHSVALAAARNVTNCMMGCNSQAASCQTTCLIPGTPPTGAATASSNANKSTACQLNCTTLQVNCQALCGRSSPSP